MSGIIEVEGLQKNFGDTRALDGVSLSVHEGSVFGLLGPNGAGKTTAVRILATLLLPDGGSARVAGNDVVTQANAVRSVIGLTGQYAAVDEKLTGHENLWMVARLLGMKSAAAHHRAEELLGRFELSEAANNPVSTYSGGMRRRADLAMSLVGRPRVLFLDEPTTGLDPASRIQMWDITRELVADGTTVLLTTQYLAEADELADWIMVIDHGRVIAEGTADELKDSTGGRNLTVQLGSADQMQEAADLLRRTMGGAEVEIEADTRSLHMAVGTDPAVAARAIAELTDAKIELTDFHLGRPSLDEVFMALTTGPPPKPATADTTGPVVEDEIGGIER